ncbi:hypothetical protein, partial [Streptomyces sp. NPDC093808]|uniref:hypothetical protein n=1 Tax=Streptomyces sp. NPDC093808 TaxID=3154985 RepID=UPI00344F2BC8
MAAPYGKRINSHEAFHVAHRRHRDGGGSPDGFPSGLSAWRLTLLGLVFLDRFGAFDGLADVVVPGPLF